MGITKTLALRPARSSSASRLLGMANSSGADTATDSSQQSEGWLECGSIAFTPNSDDMAGPIYAKNATCEEAREVVRAVRGGATPPNGFTCTSTLYSQGRSGHGMPETVYECKREGALIRWSAT
jgi:hypothetical protein